jgi:D-3-phosphoglycerate dehydrogenase
MIASRFALEKIVRNSTSVANKFRGIAARGMSSNVEVEHGRGDWKTYGDIDNYEQGKYQIKTFNKISPVGLARFHKDNYDVRTGDDEAANAHAILMRSHKLQEDDVPTTVRAIARYAIANRILSSVAVQE